MRRIEFTKMDATGNDFVVIDNRNKILKRNISLFVKKVCLRKKGVGADGVIFIEKSTKCDFLMRIFNPDGTEPHMCGNGARCVAKFAYINKIAKSKMEFETKAGDVFAWCKGNNVKIRFFSPKKIEVDFKLKVLGKTYSLSFINTGVPHTVLFSNNLDRQPVETLGREIRNHPRFFPMGTNVDFVLIKDKHTIFIRTYERGVEKETLSCGSGAVACSVISVLKKKAFSPLSIITKGKDILKVDCVIENQKVKELYLTGTVNVVYKGFLYL